LPARLAPTPLKPIDFACKSVRLSASAVLTSLRAGGHRGGARDRDAACRIDLARRGEVGGQGRRQNGNVECGTPSICFSIAAARPKVKTSLSLVAFSIAG
jgi:hypothetical protein